MRKLIALEFVTLDGVIQAGGGPDEDRSGDFDFGGWQAPFSDHVMKSVMGEQMNMPFELLIGRKTFDIWADYWPRQDFWPAINQTMKYVASNTLTSHAWQPTIFLSGDLAGEVRRLKEQPGPNLHLYGSADLLQTLLKHDLVDELWLKIFPLTLGRGKRLFSAGINATTFTLSESRVTTKGVIIANYVRAGSVQTGSL